ncbi:MAG: alanine racemase, partial [Chthoniobacterales bacterium]
MDSLGQERCWAEIDLLAVRHNAQVARERSGAELLAIVKANAYGHGLIEITRALREQAALFGVANVHEAIELQESGIEQPILILGPALPEERVAIVRCGFIASVSSAAETRAFGPGVMIDLVVDTGMGRMGCREEEAVAELQAIAQMPEVKLHSVSTHLPVADEDASFTKEELVRFQELVRQLRTRILGAWKAHVLLSAGIFGFAQHRFETVRAGLMLYGCSPLPNEQKSIHPVMTLKSRVALLRNLPAGRSISYGRTFITPRPMRVATISAGYADGFPRSLSNRDAAVLVSGQRCPVLGRITMDLTMVDVSALSAGQLGDEVVLLGRQGSEEILAAELAERAGT